MNISRHLYLSLIMVLGLASSLILVGVLALQGATAEAGLDEKSQPDPVYQLYHFGFYKDISGTTSSLYVENPNPSSVDAVISFQDIKTGQIYELPQKLQPRETLALISGGLAQLPDAAYFGVIISADQPVHSVVQVHRSTAAGDRLASYRGLSEPTVMQHFGPFQKSAPLHSGLTIWNTSGMVAEMNAGFFNLDGSYAGTQAAFLDAGQQWVLSSPALVFLPDGFIGLVLVTSDQPVVGWLNHFDLPANEVFQIDGPLNSAMLPRALKGFDNAAGTRTTTLFVANAGFDQADAGLNFYTAAGTVFYNSTFILPGMGGSLFNLDMLDELPDGEMWSVSVGGDPDLMIAELYEGMSARQSVGVYCSGPDMLLGLPRLVRSSSAHTVIGLQALDTGRSQIALTISYYDLTGTLIYSQTGSIPNSGWTFYDQDEMLQLGEDFAGSAIVETSQPLMACVDEYQYEPCFPPTGVEISYDPMGDLYQGDAVIFNAAANGTLPFTYTWTLDGSPAGENMDAYQQLFNSAGTYTIGVTVTNRCGEGNDWIAVTILEQAAPFPDLSQSIKLSGLAHVESGDRLTYTLILRNTGSVSASAVLTDPIPVHTAFLPGSASASGGSPVTESDGEIHWAGEIIPAAPVVVQFAVRVLTPTVGAVITNTACLDDGLGNSIDLEAVSIYDPGYRLSINNGALYTSIPTVTLSLNWGVESPPIETMKISNDGGFGVSTGWINVNHNFSDWQLDTLGNLILPRTVYARFRDGVGKQYGPIQDDIIFDPTPPQLALVEIITQNGRMAGAGQNVIVRVTASDDNSGVDQIEISHAADFSPGQTSNFAATGAVTNINWTLCPSGLVYVRVADRAGNLSESASQQGPASFAIYLPLVIHW